MQTAFSYSYHLGLEHLLRELSESLRPLLCPVMSYSLPVSLSLADSCECSVSFQPHSSRGSTVADGRLYCHSQEWSGFFFDETQQR